MNKSIGWLLGGMLMLTGCSMPYSFDADGNFYSQVPLAEKYPVTLQKKMQAGHHWNVLAQMEGDRILEALEGDKTSLYVDGTNAGSSAFRQGFQDLLTSYLVTKGKVVLVDKRLAKLNGAYTVKYKMHVLKHGGKDYAPPAFWVTNVRAVTAGQQNLPDHLYGRLTRNTETELLITTQVHHEDRLLVSGSRLYYLNNGDVENYSDKPVEVVVPLAPSTGIKVVNVE
jgi:hypothetical protein|tara:strand:+ start:460 stop:1137 length:678 start_codon:yes stop_codon:yes gene_type:complete